MFFQCGGRPGITLLLLLRALVAAATSPQGKSDLLRREIEAGSSWTHAMSPTWEDAMAMEYSLLAETKEAPLVLQPNGPPPGAPPPVAIPPPGGLPPPTPEPGDLPIPPYGHVLPRPQDHWHYNNTLKTMAYGSNQGQSQADMDPVGAIVPSNMKLDKKIVNQYTDLPNMRNLSREVPKTHRRRRRSDAQPGMIIPDEMGSDALPAFVKWHHLQWMNETTHGKSAYEPDYFHDESEYFGPFRVDYRSKTVFVDDWTLHVLSNGKFQGRGNVLVGPHHYYDMATNSFAAGRHNSVRRNAAVVFGGRHNVAAGSASSVLGGVHNAATGTDSAIGGGGGNVASANWTSVLGGRSNKLFGIASSIVGGFANLARGPNSAVLAGTGNHASAEAASVQQGSGNSAQSPWSTITDGHGGRTVYPKQLLTGAVPVTDQDIIHGREMADKLVKAVGAPPPPKKWVAGSNTD
eukprot:gnl/MRDRNA2_/MRDRNA2_114143_c0_seq1.p1 gnl/MRDRNA2_/MRDRNA2_114143_c0~~gnl/MRDRNA2_/MRDRNA2_114143_c0_seq1.p1  ORF type:complete len:462 (-),score=68.71 gnl/MRDRNA2_/MRDRNA2_114143_c0_seq1:3-1388(-)